MGFDPGLNKTSRLLTFGTLSKIMFQGFPVLKSTGLLKDINLTGFKFNAAKSSVSVRPPFHTFEVHSVLVVGRNFLQTLPFLCRCRTMR